MGRVSLRRIGGRRVPRASVDRDQLYEYAYWGDPDSNTAGDPSLGAYIAGAPRGATVRLLLESVFDDPGDPWGNSATCAYADGIALDQGTLAGPAEGCHPLRGPARKEPTSPPAPQ